MPFYFSQFKLMIMKYIRFQSILFCFFLVAINYSCEQKTEAVTLQPVDGTKIVYRSCPNGGDCSCSVLYKNAYEMEEVTITICGTTDGDANQCSEADPPVTCDIIDGLSHTSIDLNFDDPKHLFCMETEHGLRVDITTSGGPDTLVFTCQEGTLGADTTMVIVNSPGRRVYFRTTTECVLPRCL